MDKFQNKYRIPSARLEGWDYRNVGFYFITICVQEKRLLLGRCKNGKMVLSAAGAIVQGIWFEIPRHNDHVLLGEFIVMPNHIHGILILKEDADGILPVVSETLHGNVSTRPHPKDRKTKSEFFSEISPKAGSVGRIIGTFKTVTAKHINNAFPTMNFKWQTRFYDHIIRNDKSFAQISNYIIHNPKKWEGDRFYKHNENNNE